MSVDEDEAADVAETVAVEARTQEAMCRNRTKRTVSRYRTKSPLSLNWVPKVACVYKGKAVAKGDVMLTEDMDAVPKGDVLLAKDVGAVPKEDVVLVEDVAVEIMGAVMDSRTQEAMYGNRMQRTVSRYMTKSTLSVNWAQTVADVDKGNAVPKGYVMLAKDVDAVPKGDVVLTEDVAVEITDVVVAKPMLEVCF